MLTLILSIAAIIAICVSVAKSIRYLKKENTKMAKRFAWIAVGIFIVFSVVIWLMNKFFSILSKNDPITGNITIFSDDWKDGDYVRVKLKGNVYLSSKIDLKNIDVEIRASEPEPLLTSSIEGFIKKSPVTIDTPKLIGQDVNKTVLYEVQIIGSNGVTKGNSYFVPVYEVFSIKKIKKPVEG